MISAWAAERTTTSVVDTLFRVISAAGSSLVCPPRYLELVGVIWLITDAFLKLLIGVNWLRLSGSNSDVAERP